MVRKTIIIENEQGLHMRPAGMLVSEIKRFKSDVTIIFQDKRIDAKKLLSIVMSSIKCGSEVVFECDGEDEEVVMEKIQELREMNFGELNLSSVTRGYEMPMVAKSDID